MIKLLWNHKWNHGVEVFLQAFWLLELSFMLRYKSSPPIIQFFFLMSSWSYPQSVPPAFLAFWQDRGAFRNATVCSGSWTCYALFSLHVARCDIHPDRVSSPPLFALWNPEAVEQIVKWCVSTFRQCSNPEHFFSCMVYRLHATCWVEYKPG